MPSSPAATPVARMRSSGSTQPRVVLVVVSALCGALVAIAAGRIGGGSVLPPSNAAEATASPYWEDEPDLPDRLLRSRLVGAYLARWYASADAHGMVHLRSREVHSCYNILTHGDLPPPPVRRRPQQRRTEEDAL